MTQRLKLGVDLDHTSMMSDILEHSIEYDFAEKYHPDAPFRYFWIRPHAREFFAWALEHFDVYIVTAASQAYAEAVVKHLGIQDQIKDIYSQNHWGEKQEIITPKGYKTNDYYKKLNDFIVVDDKTYIYQGEGNTVIGVSVYWMDKNDTELLRVKALLEAILKNRGN